MAQPASASSLKICGEVTLYVKATILGTGLLTINGIPLVIAAGAVLPASVQVGADICIDLTTNLLGLITGGAVTANVHAEVKVCGVVQAYTEATALTTGLLKIGGHTFILGLGSKLPAAVEVGDDICLDLDIDAFGRVADGTVTANAHVHLKVCGTVTAYTKATATTTGILQIGSKSWILAVLSNLPATVQEGANLCLDLELDGYGRISDAEVSANVEATVKICGTVTAYTAATASTLGVLRIAGKTFSIALDGDLPANVQAGANLCLDLNLNGFFQIKDGTAVANVEATVDVCGQVTAYVAATPSVDGSLTIAGIVRKIRAGADVDAGVAVGAYLKLRLTVDVFGRIAKLTVLKVSVSLSDACDATSPTPTQDPGQSQQPGQSQAPDQSQQPGQSQEPGTSPDPGTSQDPGSSAGADESHEPAGPTEPPTAGGPTCVDSGVGSVTAEGDGGTLLPSTDALGRATRILVSNAIPLIAIGMLSAFAAWYRSRRRDDEESLDELPLAEAGLGADAGSSHLTGATGHDVAPEPRS
ncbi:MAG TPA: hypothetical protein VNL94_01195 [Candidatus Binatia bacterium]|nr:hypothetical protein [Candidatus Binatia bacterium]